jgi:hypothetical protein
MVAAATVEVNDLIVTTIPDTVRIVAQSVERAFSFEHPACGASRMAARRYRMISGI